MSNNTGATVISVIALGAFAAWKCMGPSEPKKPEHYYVLCEDLDGAGWRLIDTEYREGYLISCTYQSPDRLQVREDRCTPEGCA